MSIYQYRGYSLVIHTSALESNATLWQASTGIMGYTAGVMDAITAIMQFKQPHADLAEEDCYATNNEDILMVVVMQNGGVLYRYYVPAKLSVRLSTVTSNDESWDVITVQVATSNTFTGLRMPASGNTYLRIGAPAPRFASVGLTFHKGQMQVRYRSVSGNTPF